MKKHYKAILKVFFRNTLLKRRTELDISQEEMAFLLSMSPRGYIKLEHGECSCSALTLSVFLIFVCENPQKFLEDLQHELENAYPDVG